MGIFVKLLTLCLDVYILSGELRRKSYFSTSSHVCKVLIFTIFTSWVIFTNVAGLEIEILNNSTLIISITGIDRF